VPIRLGYSKLLLREGKDGEVIAAFGSVDEREYKVRVGKEVRHFTQDELLQEINAISQGQNTY
jgi:hypothetical protein